MEWKVYVFTHAKMVVITRRRATKEQKYRKALAIVEEISSLHCIDTLCSQNSEYKRTNDPDLRSTSSLYKNTSETRKLFVYWIYRGVHPFRTTSSRITNPSKMWQLSETTTIGNRQSWPIQNVIRQSIKFQHCESEEIQICHC